MSALGSAIVKLLFGPADPVGEGASPCADKDEVEVLDEVVVVMVAGLGGVNRMSLVSSVSFAVTLFRCTYASRKLSLPSLLLSDGT